MTSEIGDLIADDANGINPVRFVNDFTDTSFGRWNSAPHPSTGNGTSHNGPFSGTDYTGPPGLLGLCQSTEVRPFLLVLLHAMVGNERLSRL